MNDEEFLIEYDAVEKAISTKLKEIRAAKNVWAEELKVLIKEPGFELNKDALLKELGDKHAQILYNMQLELSALYIREAELLSE